MFSLFHFELFAIASVALFSFLISGVASANGPHGDFSAQTEKCERCHSMHKASTTTLLTRGTSYELCVSCHSKGIGADTAVMDGALLTPVEPGSEVLLNKGKLLGGGFDSIGAAASATSKHDIGTDAAPFGSDYGAAIQLTCMSCHTPHQGPNYRLLRRRPAGDTDLYVFWNGPQEVDDGAGGTVIDYAYTETAYGSGVTFNPADMTYGGAPIEITRNYQAGMSAWCAACHTRYVSRKDGAGYNAGDVEGTRARYRHAVDVPITGGANDYIGTVTYDFQTDLPLEDKTGTGRSGDDTMTCLTCHRAHGSDAAMTGAAVLDAATDRGVLPSGSDSMLLRMNNRQVCQTACHRVVAP